MKSQNESCDTSLLFSDNKYFLMNIIALTRLLAHFITVEAASTGRGIALCVVYVLNDQNLSKSEFFIMVRVRVLRFTVY